MGPRYAGIPARTASRAHVQRRLREQHDARLRRRMAFPIPPASTSSISRALLTARDNVRQGASRISSRSRARCRPSISTATGRGRTSIPRACISSAGRSAASSAAPTWARPLAAPNQVGVAVRGRLRNHGDAAPVAGLFARAQQRPRGCGFPARHLHLLGIRACRAGGGRIRRRLQLRGELGRQADAHADDPGHDRRSPPSPTDRAVPNSSTLRLADLLGLPTITATLTSRPVRAAHALHRGRTRHDRVARSRRRDPGRKRWRPTSRPARNWPRSSDPAALQITITNSAILAPQ